MAISDEITRLKNAKASIKTAIENKGVTVGNGTIDTYASKIDEIETGSSGGVDIREYFKETLTYGDNNVPGFIHAILKVPEFNMGKGSYMKYMFRGMSNITELPYADTSNITDMSYMCHSCTKLITFPQYNTAKVRSIGYMFYGCQALTTLPELDGSSITSITSAFTSCSKLATFPGFKNYGKGFNTTQSANYSAYKLSYSPCSSLTEESLINILNNLYDIASMGCNTQTITLGSTLKAKLTSTAGQEALANAQTKGWTIA